MRGMATHLQDNQELLVVKDKDGRPPGELGEQVHGVCYFSFIALTLLVGQKENMDVDLLVVMT